MFRHGRSEYLVLRRTIAQRGALRPILFLSGIAIWSVTTIAVLVWLPRPVAAFIPLLVLIATFEAIRPLHFGAERIGRYLQVFYEEAGEAGRPLRDSPSWERIAMQFGSVPGAGGHPLFVPSFFLATLANYFVAIQPGPGFADAIIVGVAHAVFVAWMFASHRAMKKQRQIEVERMRQLLTK
jgi:hypothetical protein